ncbi:HNH endonuclease [Candidatus Pacearchaeota archaeon]|nr:HNH endonuclease [Candidatus Pacearchaeota archaeon]
MEGRRAGFFNKGNGYMMVSVNGVQYRAHRIARLLFHGHLPESELDHRDRVRHHNWILNLREVSHQENMKNANKRSDNTSGVPGVTWDKVTGKWRASITLSGKHKTFGRYKDKALAVKARWNAEVKYGFPDCNTTSAAYLWLHGNKI